MSNCWYYKENIFEDLENYIGFVYIITNLTNQRKYIGKKNFYTSRMKKIKGKRKRIKSESDWKTYYGSNKELSADVIKLGEENFHREILRLCKSKGEMSYFEAKYQFLFDVLFDDIYYNTWIMCRVNASHLKKVEV